MNTLKVSIVATLVALCVATNYALVGVFQVKAMDFIVFVGGFCFGPFAGAFIGILSWTVYGVINPYGFIPQVWLATMFSEAIYGLLGGLLGKNLALTNFNDERFKLSVFFG
ncbi:MAG: ECF transporter S component, partial [Candidatus Bathyarchaeota archaeon]|nr:ECF transporter S component [Candidatus Bathyarchaeota archaeon]